jgi:hypothetical protein
MDRRPFRRTELGESADDLRHVLALFPCVPHDSHDRPKAGAVTTSLGQPSIQSGKCLGQIIRAEGPETRRSLSTRHRLYSPPE